MFAALFLGTRHCLGQLSLIRSQNCTLFVFFWIPYFVRNVMKNFENCYQSAQPVGKLDQRFIRFYFQEQQFEH